MRAVAICCHGRGHAAWYRVRQLRTNLQGVILALIWSSTLGCYIPGKAYAGNDSILQQLEQRRQREAGKEVDAPSAARSQRIVVRIEHPGLGIGNHSHARTAHVPVM